jgi:hypothetical protein
MNIIHIHRRIELVLSNKPSSNKCNSHKPQFRVDSIQKYCRRMNLIHISHWIDLILPNKSLSNECNPHKEMAAVDIVE